MIGALLGAISFLGIFFARYAFVDGDLYQARDDGVITMSVGRHLVEYGFIGVGPSGPIVEASSSPLQTILFALNYAIHEPGFATFAHWQTILATAALGAVIGAAFGRDGILSAAIWSLATATTLVLFMPFLLWHGSGMENALGHVLFPATVVALAGAYAKGSASAWLALLAAVTALTRIDSIIYVAPVMAFFAWMWWRRWQNARAFWIGAATALLWAVVMGLRYWYFGQLFPNTAFAQDISLRDRITAIATGNSTVILSSLLVAVVLIVNQGWWLLLPQLRFLSGLQTDPATLFLRWSAGIMSLVAFTTPFLFGPPRIDVTRLSTHVTPVIVLAVVLSLRHATDIRKALFRFSILPIWAAGIILIVQPPLERVGLGTYYLGWSTKPFEEVRQRFLDFAEREDIRRATIANPDLGVMSWHKTFNIVDLGAIGSPEVALLDQHQGAADFFLDIALPDIIESHGVWSLRHCQRLFLDPRFGTIYEPLPGTRPTSELCASANPDTGYWVRRDILKGSQSAERQFLDRLQLDLSAARISDEIDACRQANANCAYITRTVYRFIPELRKSGKIQEVSERLEGIPGWQRLQGWHEPASTRRLVNGLLANDT